MIIDDSQVLGGRHSGSNLFVSSGAVVQPTISYDSETLKLTLGVGTYRTFITTDFSKKLIQYTIPETIFDVTQNTNYYVCVKYNNGSPYAFLTSLSESQNDSDVLAIYTIFIETTHMDKLNWGTEAISLANKLNERLIDTNRFGRVSGLSISSSNSQIFCTGGDIYIGSNRLIFEEFSSATDDCDLMVKNSGGTWDFSSITAFPNTKYDSGGSGLVDLTDGQYGVAWVWRCMGAEKEMYIAMGGGSFASIESAKLDKIPSDLDPRIPLISMLLGRIIFLKGSTTAFIESAFDTVFNANAPTQHNALFGIQGGAIGDYQHMTSTERDNHNKLINMFLNISKLSVYESGSHNHSILASGVYQKLIIPLTLENKTSDFTIDAVNSRLVYTGSTTKRFTFNGSASLLNAGTPNMTIHFSLFKNGAQLTNTESALKLDASSSIGSINASTTFVLSTNQYIELFAYSDKVNTFSTAHLQLLFVEDLGFTFNGV